MANEGVAAMKRKKKGSAGSSFENFLKEDGTHAETSAAAIKRVLAWQLESAMARQMRTSRSQLDRILDPENDRIQLDTVFNAARVLGRAVRLELV
jgi:hypothetical protein